MDAREKAIKAFLWTHMYRHPALVLIRERAASVVRDLFLTFRDRPDLMSREWAAKSGPLDHSGRRERLVCDYIAGMTDRFALSEHRRHFAVTPELRYWASPA
jgi:dGTPase